jgi:predicted NBD/HSP70 family sugar kinase/mannose-6-phosphate isomerase class I
MFIHADKEGCIGVDVGGTHVSAAWIGVRGLEETTVSKRPVDAHAGAAAVIRSWAEAIRVCMDHCPDRTLRGIGLAMPGPFDYPRGVSLIEGLHKYEHLLGLDVRDALLVELGFEVPLVFENDAFCFGLGAYRHAAGAPGPAAVAPRHPVASAHGPASPPRVLALTLGTGLGSVFIEDGRVCRDGTGVPAGGYLYNAPFLEGIAEDYLSTRGLLAAYAAAAHATPATPAPRTGPGVASTAPTAPPAQSAGAAPAGPGAHPSGASPTGAEDLARRAGQGDSVASAVFAGFGQRLGALLAPVLGTFRPDTVILGGSISKASALFVPALEETLAVAGVVTPIHVSVHTEFAAMEGAAGLLGDAADPVDPAVGTVPLAEAAPALSWRKTLQPLLPIKAGPAPDAYDRYPFHALGNNRINAGYDSLAAWIARHPNVRIDGYGGNDWGTIRKHLAAALKRLGKRVGWYETATFIKEEQEILHLTAPYAGATGSVWGKIADLRLEDFFRVDALQRVQPGMDLSIGFGVGAALLPWTGPIVYIDLPKNEIQYRMRAGSTVNLGLRTLLAPAEMYKRSYFIDWVVLNRHRARIGADIAVVADGQWNDDVTWAHGDAIREGLRQMATSVIRVRPWFEAGAWGGQWLKQHIPGLPASEINYAWSFELIVPENGLVFESDGWLLEVAFDWLMELETDAVLGRDAPRFGPAFPIRFDFLDTFDGGNLSIQCHPSLDYIREQFGETITQDETYYILDCEDDAGVYLGFQEDIDPGVFREVLENSHAKGVPVDIGRFVQRHPARPHDLFLIPNRTVHSAGKNNLVLEISATPYIYTFKMYDWVRPDLNGAPRPINIDHAFRNLDMDRRGDNVAKELISKPVSLHDGLVHLPTHPDHFYDVHRLEFTGEVEVLTNDQCHVLMLVEGASLLVKTPAGGERRFHFAETFVIPSAAGRYTLRSDRPVKVVKAFIK